MCSSLTLQVFTFFADWFSFAAYLAFLSNECADPLQYMTGLHVRAFRQTRPGGEVPRRPRAHEMRREQRFSRVPRFPQPPHRCLGWRFADASRVAVCSPQGTDVLFWCPHFYVVVTVCFRREHALFNAVTRLTVSHRSYIYLFYDKLLPSFCASNHIESLLSSMS